MVLGICDTSPSFKLGVLIEGVVLIIQQFKFRRCLKWQISPDFEQGGLGGMSKNRELVFLRARDIRDY